MEIHFALAHFPIALLITGALLLLAVLVTGHKGAGKDIALGMLSAGAGFSVLAVAAGLWVASEHETHHADALQTHRLAAIATMVVAILGVFSHWLRQRVSNADVVRNLFFFTAALLAGVTGKLGGEMAHEEHEAPALEHAHESGTAHEHHAASPHAHEGGTDAPENETPEQETEKAKKVGPIDHGANKQDKHDHEH